MPGISIDEPRRLHSPSDLVQAILKQRVEYCNRRRWADWVEWPSGPLSEVPAPRSDYTLDAGPCLSLASRQRVLTREAEEFRPWRFVVY